MGQKTKGTWAPTADALKSMLRQRKFTTLEGESAAMGDLSSVVLHSLNVTHVKSSFPMALGARITGVDDRTYSSTGTSFSTISARERSLFDMFTPNQSNDR